MVRMSLRHKFLPNKNILICEKKINSFPVKVMRNLASFSKLHAQFAKMWSSTWVRLIYFFNLSIPFKAFVYWLIHFHLVVAMVTESDTTAASSISRSGSFTAMISSPSLIGSDWAHYFPITVTPPVSVAMVVIQSLTSAAPTTVPPPFITFRPTTTSPSAIVHSPYSFPLDEESCLIKPIKNKP